MVESLPGADKVGTVADLGLESFLGCRSDGCLDELADVPVATEPDTEADDENASGDSETVDFFLSDSLTGPL